MLIGRPRYWLSFRLNPQLTSQATGSMCCLTLSGFHKQSRNIPQILGVTRYETPLDSRVNGWAQEHLDLPDHLAGEPIQDNYEDAMDWLQALCDDVGVVPCVFDAAVFAGEDHGWTRDRIEATLP